MSDDTTVPVPADGPVLCRCGNPDNCACPPAPVTADGLRDRMILRLHEHRGHGHDLPTCPVLADAFLTELVTATDPGVDPHRRMVEHLGRAWPDLTEDPVYLDQLAHEALSVRWEHAAHLAARVGDAERRAERAEGQLSALRDHETRWETEKTRADRAETTLTETIEANDGLEELIQQLTGERDDLRARLTGVAIHANRIGNCIWPDTPAWRALADLRAALEETNDG